MSNNKWAYSRSTSFFVYHRNPCDSTTVSPKLGLKRSICKVADFIVDSQSMLQEGPTQQDSIRMSYTEKTP